MQNKTESEQTKMVSQQKVNYVLELKRFSGQYKQDVLAGNSLDDLIEKQVKSNVNVSSEGLKKLEELEVARNKLLEKQIIQINENLGQCYNKMLDLYAFRNFYQTTSLNKEILGLCREKRELENQKWKNTLEIVKDIIYQSKDYHKAKYNALSLLEA